MSLIVPIASERLMLQTVLNIAPAQNLRMKLFANDFTPTRADTEASYKEVYGSSYTDIVLVPGNWTFEEGERVIARYPTQMWTFGGAVGFVYGYYVVQGKSGKLLWAERFREGPFNVYNNGDQIKVTPMIIL